MCIFPNTYLYQSSNDIFLLEMQTEIAFNCVLLLYLFSHICAFFIYMFFFTSNSDSNIDILTKVMINWSFNNFHGFCNITRSRHFRPIEKEYYCNLPQYMCVCAYVQVYTFIVSTSNMFVYIQSHFSLWPPPRHSHCYCKEKDLKKHIF